jgi:hypothetical protein
MLALILTLALSTGPHGHSSRFEEGEADHPFVTGPSTGCRPRDHDRPHRVPFPARRLIAMTAMGMRSSWGDEMTANRRPSRRVGDRRAYSVLCYRAFA